MIKNNGKAKKCLIKHRYIPLLFILYVTFSIIGVMLKIIVDITIYDFFHNLLIKKTTFSSYLHTPNICFLFLLYIREHTILNTITNPTIIIKQCIKKSCGNIIITGSVR